jgi:hypothetical protein
MKSRLNKHFFMLGKFREFPAIALLSALGLERRKLRESSPTRIRYLAVSSLVKSELPRTQLG